MPTLNEMLNKYNNQNNPGGTEKEDKSILKTASAGLQYLGQGALRGLEAVFVDTPLQIAAGTRKLFGDDEGAKGLMEASNVSLTNALINTAAGKENNPFLNNNENLWNEEVDKNSYIKEDNLAGKIISATGEMLPTIAIGGSISGGQGAKQLGGNILLGSKAFSGATNEAYQDSGDIGKSMLYGLGSAGTELLTEKISGGIPGLKQINGTTKKEIAKNYLKSMIGEGAEEVIASLANPLLQTTYKGTDALKQYGTSDYWKGVAESGLVGAAVGGLLDSPNTISSLRNSQNSSKTTTNLNRNTQNSINTLINDNNAENGAKYSYLPTNNEKSNNLRQSASNYFNNSQETINMINTIDKVVQDKGYNVLFDNTIVNSKGESVNAQIKALDNGEIEIKINPNSERAGEFLLCHEITHAIETNSMKELVMDYASKHSDFNESLESLKQSYGTNEVTDEVLADISGQLFGTQEFINNLSMQQPNVFKRIYNKIVELANKITGNSKESLFIKDLKNKWETAYRNTSLEESVNNLNDSTKYMMTSVKGMQNGLNVNNRYQDIKNKYDRAIQLESNGQYDNEAIRQETGWFKDKEGNWEFEISDHNTKFKIQPKANTKYKLSDIFEANTLYEMYPELKDVKIQFKNIKSKGNYSEQTKTISVKNDALKNLDDVRGTILHEIQHYIQNVENLPKGTSILFGNEQYANSKGEIEAADTKNRRNLTVEQRKSIIPESAKENPIHPNRDAILKHKRSTKEKIVEIIYNKLENKSKKFHDIIENEIDKLYNKNGDDVYENIEKYETQILNQIGKTNELDIKEDESNSTDRLGIRRQYDVEKELDNSSFSYDKWQEYVENNYKSSGTRTDMKKHLYPLETAQTENKTVEKLPTAKRDIPQNPTKESTYNTTEEIRELTTKQQRHKKVQEYRQQAKEDIGNMSDWVDTSLMKQKTNTMKRNLRDIMPKEQADSLYEKYFQNISKNNATIENEINKYNSKIQKLNLNDKESTAVQMLGEYKYNPDTNITGLQVTDYISNNKLDYNKISKSVEVFRETYDELFTKVNETLKEQGYDEIPYRKGYFPHFIEEHGKTILGRFAEKLGWKFNNQELPTDIAGLTENFLPGKKWTSFTQHRKGKITDYNALKGFDNYVRGAMDVIYHTEDIQRLRALENEIRYQHSEKGVQQEIDKISQNDMLTSEQQEKLIEEVYDNYKIPLPNFVTNLRDFTNNLAGKKSALDRSMEQGIGRDMYNTMSNISNRVSANMVGLNISSALTNFIPITQAWSQVKTKNLVKAVKQTMSSTFTDDHFADSSTFLTNRTKKADRLYKTGLEKASDKAGVLFEAIDSFTSNVIVRSKYLENIENGMSKTQAIENADEFAKDVIAGRSKGELPTIFNSKNPVVKLVTAFQLEVNNQYGYMFKDLPKDLKDEGMAKLVGAFLKMFLGAWLYNKAKESITGTKSAFSPIDMIEETLETVSNEDLSTYEKISTTAKNYAQDLPFVGGLLGGGRLPINSAIPDVAVVTESITNLSSEDTDKKQSALKNLTNELKKPFFYVVMPFGGGQLKKTIEGASMYSGKLPTAGSYTNSGNLRFTADKTPTGVAKALTFGQYSSKEAQDYIDSGFKTISKNHIQEMKDLGMTSTEYRKYRNGLAKAGTTNSEKLNYINNLDVSIEQKNIMANNVVDSDKYTVDMSNYNDYGSYETMKYALQNPTNYSIITSITNYDDYLSYKEEVNNIKEKYSGTENSTVRKQKVFQYVNSLPYSKTQKIILFNMLGNYGISNYKNDVHSYINGLDISKSEKEQMWQQIYGK